jgi:hypothetical protein
MPKPVPPELRKKQRLDRAPIRAGSGSRAMNTIQLEAKMVDQPQSAASAQSNPWNLQYGPLVALNEQAFTFWARGISAFADEVGRFTQTRLHEDGEVWQMLATCRNPMEVLECQRQYAEKTAGQYLEEANKITQLFMNSANDSLSSLGKTTSI